MFTFLLPKAVKQGRQFAQDARKMVAYKRDLWDDTTLADFEAGIGALERANASREAAQIEAAAKALDQICHQYLPKVPDAGWRENVEVFLVAIVIALAVRTYFLQPFTIPTGSMQPTLNGILGFPTQDEPPNALARLVQTGLLGRTWVNIVARDAEEIQAVQTVKRWVFFDYTLVTTDKNSYLIHAPQRTLEDYFFLFRGARFEPGQPIARGFVSTGDHVFVDKLSYHFRKPTRADVFVFNTQKVPTGENRVRPDGPSQFYIKRLVGLPNDELRIDRPNLFVNGELAQEEPIRRVMAAKDGYRGYAFGFPNFLMPILRAPDDSYTVPPKYYFALGDNSYHSSDSRDWGPVPEQNLMGRGVFVYWPFGEHWGLIR